MKTLVCTVAALFFLLFILTALVPYPAARETALASGFDSSTIDTGLQYAFERRFFSWTWTAVELTLLYVLAMTSVGRRLADRFLGWTGNRRILAVLGVGLVYLVIE